MLVAIGDIKIMNVVLTFSVTAIGNFVCANRKPAYNNSTTVVALHQPLVLCMSDLMCDIIYQECMGFIGEGGEIFCLNSIVLVAKSQGNKILCASLT